MSARGLDGRARADEIGVAVGARAAAFEATTGRRPLLADVLVGDDPAGAAYARAKGRAAERRGVAYRLVHLPGGSDTAAVVGILTTLCADPAVDGILVAHPLPAACDEATVRAAIDPARDVDGVTPGSRARLLDGRPGPRPATALAVLDLLTAGDTALVGARAVVIGRSPVVGMPAALLLVASHATVTIAHSRTRDLAAVTRVADVIVAAAGVPGLLGPDHVRPGAVVIDVGTNVVAGPDGERIVDFERVVEVAGVITPVPGGVGPVTTAIVLRTTLELAEARADGR